MWFGSILEKSYFMWSICCSHWSYNQDWTNIFRAVVWTRPQRQRPSVDAKAHQTHFVHNDALSCGVLGSLDQDGGHIKSLQSRPFPRTENISALGVRVKDAFLSRDGTTLILEPPDLFEKWNRYKFRLSPTRRQNYWRLKKRFLAGDVVLLSAVLDTRRSAVKADLLRRRCGSNRFLMPNSLLDQQLSQ